VPHRGGKLPVTRAGVSATDVTASEANGAAGEPGRLQHRLASGGTAGRSLGDQPSGQGGAVPRCPLMSAAIGARLGVAEPRVLAN